MNIKNEQLELTIEGICGSDRPQSKIENRKSKISSLWFSRMRQLVDAARNWPAAPEPRATFQLHLTE